MWVTALDYVVRWCGSDIAHWPCEKTNGGKGHLPHGRRLLATAVAPHRHLRTARGRCGSLLLHRGGLSPLTPCRFHRRTLLFPRELTFGALSLWARAELARRGMPALTTPQDMERAR